MIGVAAVIAVILAAVGVPWATILPFAFILACPLMMIVMMVMMGGMAMHRGQSSKTDTHADARS
jgi:hypothetical protein